MLAEVLVEMLSFNRRLEIERCRATCKEWLGLIDNTAQTLPRHTIREATFQVGVASTAIRCLYANSHLFYETVVDDDATGDRLLAVSSHLNDVFITVLRIHGQRSTTFPLNFGLLRSFKNVSIGELNIGVEHDTPSDIAPLIRECKAFNLQKIALHITPQLVEELEVSGFYNIDVVRTVTEIAINLVGDTSKPLPSILCLAIVRRLFALPNCATFRVFSRCRYPNFIQQTVVSIIQTFENATDLSGMVRQFVIGETYQDVGFPVAEAGRAYTVPVATGEAMEADVYYFRNKAEELTVFFAKCEFDRRQFLIQRGRIPLNEAGQCAEII